MTGERKRLAVALADAFLAGAWTPDGLRTQGELALQARHRWLRRVVAEVLGAYPEPPSDRPRELFAFVQQTGTTDGVERRAARLGRSLPMPRHRLGEPTSMVRRPFPVVPLDHAGDLAELLGVSMEELLWFADTKGLQRRAASDRLQHYRSTWVSSSSGGGHPGTSAFRMRRRLAQPHLPQGAPTSPQLANLCAFGLDRRLTACASVIGARYTRYADDLTFSGDGLAARQRGIVVNASTTVRRADYDTLRAILHNCVQLGPSSQNRLQHDDFHSQLRGRMAWVASLDSERGRKLLATFDRIDWS